MARELKEITLPISQHKCYVIEKVKYGEHLELQGVLYAQTSIENEVKDAKKSSGKTKQTINGAVLVELLRKKLMIFVKKIVLASDVEGLGKKDQEVKITEEFIDDMEKEDGEFLSSEIAKIVDGEKKS